MLFSFYSSLEGKYPANRIEHLLKQEFNHLLNYLKKTHLKPKLSKCPEDFQEMFRCLNMF